MKLASVSHNARALTDKEFAELLGSPAICRLATVRPDSRPHVAPMWFLHQAGTFYFMQRKNVGKQKITNLQANPHVALCIDTCSPPYRGILVEGTAEMTEERADEVTLAICQKYLGAAEGQQAFESLRAESPLWLITVTPTKVMHYQT